MDLKKDKRDQGEQEINKLRTYQRVNDNNYLPLKKKSKGGVIGIIILCLFAIGAILSLTFGSNGVASVFFDVNSQIEDDFENNRDDEIIKAFDMTSTKDEADADSYNYYALALMDNGLYEEALTALETAFKKADSDDTDILMTLNNNMSWALNELGRAEEALVYGEAGIKLGDRGFYIYSNYGNSLYILYRYEEAIEAYKNSLNAEGPEIWVNSNLGECYYQLGEFSKAKDYFHKYWSENPTEVQALYDLGWAKAMMDNDYLAGYNEIEKILEFSDDYGQAVRIKVEYLNSFGRYQMSKDFLEATDHDYILENDSTIYEYMVASIQTGDNEKAVALGQEVIESGSIDLNIWYTLLDGYYNLDRHEVAKEMIKEYSPDGEMDFYFLIEQAYMYGYNLYYDEELVILEKLLAGDYDIEMDQYDYEDVLYELLYILYDMNDYDRMINLCEENMGQVEWINLNHYLGKAYFEIGETELALENYQLAIEFDPEGSLVYEDLVTLYYIEGDYELALEALDEGESKGFYEESVAEYREFLEYTIETGPGVQLTEYIRENYMYFEETQEFLNLEKVMNPKKSLTEADYSRITQVAFGDDLFSYIIYPEDFDYYMELEDEPSVYSTWLSDTDLFVRIDFFSTLTDVEFLRVLKTVEAPKETNLILDLRYNYGGDTDSAFNILDFLLPTQYLGDWDSPVDQVYSYYSDGSMVEFKDIYVLVDSDSASSSEIVTLGLKEFLPNTTIIGEITYGKGVGQTGMLNMKYRFGMYVVNAYWTINGLNIHEEGIQPDVIVSDGELQDYLDIIGVQF